MDGRMGWMGVGVDAPILVVHTRIVYLVLRKSYIDMRTSWKDQGRAHHFPLIFFAGSPSPLLGAELDFGKHPGVAQGVGSFITTSCQVL
jgi:hypothetical protein